tara:strand:+ start:3498 stop:5165 length:1668 start_codon:yes stop_codon:yes gene_type:complete
MAQPLLVSALSEANRLRLVKASKCPTHQEVPVLRPLRPDLAGPPELYRQAGLEQAVESLPTEFTDAGQRWTLPDLQTGEIKHGQHEKITGYGNATIVSHREWSGEYRIRTQSETADSAPPEQECTRYTHTLSLAGARKLADSCHYMAIKKGGYSTFLTLTFDEAGRQRVAERKTVGRCTEFEWVKGKPVPLVQHLEPGVDLTYSTIQKELGRFWDGVNKTYQRGFVATKTYPWGAVECISKGETLRTTPSVVIGWKGAMCGVNSKAPKGQPVRESIHYCWVAENPKAADGRDNPHVHILMRWRVPFRLFGAWSVRIESLWGQGFAHLEKIKEPEKAGAYMAKAAGYLTKATGASEQGRIRGNRYAISQPSRAPEWVCVGHYEAGIMGSLIADTHDFFSHLYGHVFAKRKKLNEQLNQAEKGSKERYKIGRTLEKVRTALNSLPAVVSKYQITFKAKEGLMTFLNWACDDTGAKMAAWLPVKGRGESWSDDPADKSRTLYGHKLAAYLENQRLRRCERWRGGDHWWVGLMDWARKFEAVPEYEDDGRWERQNWGSI